MIYGKKERLTVRLYAAAAALLAALLLSVLLGTGAAVPAGKDRRVQRAVSFLRENGWEVAPVPAETVFVHIPAEFDAVYENYNAIQLEQGFDLRLCRDADAVRFTFIVDNYPGYEHTELIRANVLFAGNEMIAADICSAALDGFMHGAKKQDHGKDKT